jgi:hypothetical protein
MHKSFAQQVEKLWQHHHAMFPPPSPSTTRQKIGPQIATNRKESLETILDGVIEPLCKPRKVHRVQLTRAGSHCKARWEGRADCAFGENAIEANSRLKMFAGSLKERPPKKRIFNE